MRNEGVAGGAAVLDDPLVAGLLGSTPPSISTERSTLLLEQHFGIVAEAREIACERDQNFHVIAHDGQQYALKIANPQESRESTDFQTEALRWIEQVDPGLPVPEAVPALDGRYLIPLQLPDGRETVARVLRWLKGVPLYKVARTEAIDRAIGASLARLGLALRDFRHPGATRELLWDIRHAPRLRPLLAALEDDGIVGSLRAELDRYEVEVVPSLSGLRHQVVHNDMNHHNVMVGSESSANISGIIDFGDLVDTSLAIDVAVAASYMADHPTDPLRAVCNVVAAYHAITPLLHDEIALMRDLIVARLMTSIIITGWRAQRYPSNAAYILRNNGPAKRAMRNFATLDRARVTAALMRACDME